MDFTLVSRVAQLALYEKSTTWQVEVYPPTEAKTWYKFVLNGPSSRAHRFIATTSWVHRPVFRMDLIGQ